jgi:hypothetical protein
MQNVSAPTLAVQLPAADALAQITAALGHLPAADFGLSPITPDRLDISIHDNLDGFEQWRAALGIAAADVEHQQRPRSAHMTLRGRTTFAGATIELVGYAPALPTVGEGNR